MIANSDGFEIPMDFEPLCPEFLNTAIDTLFDRVAERQPNRIAIEEAQHQWTYRELQQQVNRLAALLTQIGATDQGRPVALWLPIGAPVIAAMLATLKAGGFYVVIEPHYPVTRNTTILENSRAAWVITDEAHKIALAAHFPAKRIVMWHADAVVTSAITKPTNETSSRRAAITYTSGSTGTPKGVLHSQAFILNWTQLYASDLHLAPSDRVSLLYSAGVAGSIRDIYGALLTGSTLLPFAAREHSADELAKWAFDYRVSIYHSVATLFRELMTSQFADCQFPEVRVLAFGGERVLERDLALIKERFQPGTMVYTSIGSTEAGTFARLFLRSDSDPGYTTIIPLGVAPPECRVILVDDGGTPITDGAAGEIVVESRYLADGYWRSEHETALVFSTASHDPTLRRYHTGDLGVRDASGTLCHAGRTDRQFKVRGYRVEPAEIETALLSVAQVNNAVVQADLSLGETQIVAYLEGSGTRAIRADSLRTHCARLLPQYMIPAAFYTYDRFPRLPNNKVDIRRLSPTDPQIARRLESYLDRGDASTLLQVWQQFFPNSGVTAEADFFDLGGDSLMAMRIMNRVTKLYGVEASITLLFHNPTLGTFEKALEALRFEQENKKTRPLITSTALGKASVDHAGTTFPYAQTNAELYEQLDGLGYTRAQLDDIAAAYDLALSLFSDLLRPAGKPFICHLIGTASILARHGAPFPAVLAGLLHGSYTFGKFESLRPGLTPGKRQYVRAIIGEEAEELVHYYSLLPWNARSIESLTQQLPGKSKVERCVIFMRLANELEEGADASLLYWTAEMRSLKVIYLPLSVAVARAMSMHRLADELEQSQRRITI